MKRKLFTLFAICVMAVTSAWASTEPDYVEIGGLRWATMNLGATTVAGTTTNPESAFGTYYSWGATSTIVKSIPWSSWTAWQTRLTPTFISGKEGGYTQANDPLWNGSAWTYSPATGKTRSENFDSHDAAKTVLGGSWRMPSEDEFKALVDACGSAQTTYSSGDITEGGIYWISPTKGSSVTIDGVAYSVPGNLFVSSTDKTKRVFFPAAGYMGIDNDGATLYCAGSRGDYWSSSLYDTDKAYELYFCSIAFFFNSPDNNSRYCGYTVRAVQDIPITTTKALQNAVNAGGDVQLGGDIDLEATISVPSDKTVTLDLNGHVLNAGNLNAPTSDGDKASVIYNEGTLTIIDSNPSATHSGSYSTLPAGGVLTGGKGYLKSGNERGGGAIYNKGTLTMTGGTITGNTGGLSGGGVQNEGTFTMTGGTISGNKVTDFGGGVLTVNPGAFTVGGTARIVDNTAMDGVTEVKSNVYENNNSGYIGLVTISTETPLATGASIGISFYSSSFPYKLSTNGSATDVQYFFADASDSYHITFNTTGGYLEMLEGGTTETITVNKCGNASYVTTSALDFTDATVKAYVATAKPDANATSVTLTRVKQVPAGTPIFVFTDEALTDAKSYDVSVGSSTTLTDWTTDATITNNVLEGSTTDTKTVNTANETVYALKNTDGKLHKCDNGVIIPAKKAYISVSTGSGAKESLTLVFGEATGVANVDANVDANQAREGKYIENGKIVIVKNGKKFNTAGQLMK